MRTYDRTTFIVMESYHLLFGSPLENLLFPGLSLIIGLFIGLILFPKVFVLMHLVNLFSLSAYFVDREHSLRVEEVEEGNTHEKICHLENNQSVFFCKGC